MSGWTDAEVERLKTLVQDGLSGSQIAAEMGKSRNSVIAYVDRHLKKQGIRLVRPVWGKPAPVQMPVPAISIAASRAKAIRGGIANKARLHSLPTSSPAVKPEAVVALLAVSGEIQAPRRVSLMDLGWRDCRYVIAGDGANALFCGDETVSPSCSWCAHHRALVFVPRVAVEKAREAVAA